MEIEPAPNELRSCSALALDTTGRPLLLLGQLARGTVLKHRAMMIALFLMVAVYSGYNLRVAEVFWAEARDSRDTPEFRQRREAMVSMQIVARGVRDRDALEALRAVPRHLFLPDHLKPYAYQDSPLPIGNGQTISQPYIVAFMTEALELKRTDRVLEIGTGSGYQAAVLARICAEVYTI